MRDDYQTMHEHSLFQAHHQTEWVEPAMHHLDHFQSVPSGFPQSLLKPSLPPLL
jgi:hypothetical protein